MFKKNKERMDVRTWEIKKERQDHRIIVPNRQLPRFCFNGSSSMQNLSNLIFIIFLLFVCSLKISRTKYIVNDHFNLNNFFFIIMSFQSDMFSIYVWDINYLLANYTSTTLTFYDISTCRLLIIFYLRII